MQKLKNVIISGFPDNKSNLDKDIIEYWPYRDELSVYKGIIFKNKSKLIIPKELRKEILNILHSSHMGRDKMKYRAREIMFWPGLNNDINNLIDNCSACLLYNNKYQKEPLMCHEIPSKVWDKLGMDMFQIKNRKYIIAVDYFSKYVEISEIKTNNFENVKEFCKKIFCTHGIPTVIVSDGGSPFNSYQFKQLANDYNFIHKITSAHYPQSNGQVERMIATIKKLLIKAQYTKGDYHYALLELMNIPLSNNLPSPPQLLYNRRLRTKLPISDSLLKPRLNHNNKI